MPTVQIRHCSVAKQDISLHYETFGDKAHPAVLFIPGVNTDMLAAFPTALCTAIQSAGPFFVIRFDQRDQGLSTMMHLPGPAIPRLLLPEWMSFGEQLAYTLPDLALDAFALMDELGVTAAHLVAESAGGRVAQLMAHASPERVSSVGLLMSTCGAKDLPKPSSDVRSYMMRSPASTNKADVVEHRFQVIKNCAATGAQDDDTTLREIANSLYERSAINLATNTRPIAAVIRSASQENENKLGKIPESVPVVVIHGEKDVMLTPVHGKRLAASIKQARLVSVPDMGHYIHPKDISMIADHLLENIRLIAK